MTIEQSVRQLGESTTYEQLRALFYDILKEIKEGRSGEQHVRALNDVIGNLRKEADNDKSQLAKLIDQQQQFLSNNSGAFGWLKRHTPFSNTRKQGKQLDSDIYEKKLEIAADVFISAFGEVLREGIATDEKRTI